MRRTAWVVLLLHWLCGALEATMPDLPRVARSELARYAAFVADTYPPERAPTLRVWAVQARQRGLPCEVGDLPTWGETTAGSYAPGWLVVLLEVISSKDGTVGDKGWQRVVARQGAMSAAWRLGGFAVMLLVWRARA